MRNTISTRASLADVDIGDVDELYQRLSDIRMHIKENSSPEEYTEVTSKMHQLRRHLHEASEKLITRGPAADSYEIIWEEGMLGIVLKPQEDGPPKIRRITGKGSSIGLEHACLGDELVSINGRSITECDYGDVVRELRNPCFPMFLNFRARSSVDAARETLHRPSSRFSTGDIFGRESSYISNSSTSPPSSKENSICESINENGDIPLKEVGEYDILWENGVLGLSLKSVEGIPLVKRITGKGNAANLNQVNPGDFLIMINNKYTSDMSFQESMDLLQTLPKPLMLRFLSCYNSKTEDNNSVVTPNQDEFSITWGDESIGIVLEQSKNKGVSVRRLTGVGLASKTGILAVGDELVSVANVNVSDLGFKATIQFLRCVAKPTQLVFRRKRKVIEENNPIDIVHPNPALDNQDSGVSSSDNEEDGSDVSREDGKSKQIVLYWTEGPLGMTMKMSDEGKICLSRLTGRGTTPGIWKLHPNDLLVAVNQYDTVDMKFADAMKLLKTLSLPITLVFEQQSPRE